MHVWLRQSPRALLVADTGSSGQGGKSVLVISTASPSNPLFTAASTSTSRDDGLAGSATARAVVEMVSINDVDLSTCVRLTEENATGQAPAGCLGLMNVGTDLFLCVVTQANEVGAVRPGEVVMSIASVAFFCVNRPTWDGLDVPELPNPMGQSGSSSSLDPYDAILPQDRASTSAAAAATQEHPCASLKRLLGMGSFYYAANGTFDISTRLDRRLATAPTAQKTHDISQYDGRFVWNTFMIHPLMEFRGRLEDSERQRLDEEGFFLLAIQGYVGVYDMTPPALSYSDPPQTTRQQTSLGLISRLSWKRAGTRFNTRGVDDDGNVANFVETETLFAHEGVSVSYVQLRGSVPLFWEQQGIQTWSPRIQITRSRLASQPAFDRHFADLLSHYSRVHALNLLGTRDAETVLSSAYAEHVRSSAAVEQAVPPPEEDEKVALEQDERMGITNFDFHGVSRVVGGLDGVRSELKQLGPVLLKREDFSCTIVDSAGAVRRRQRGVFRTNCLDCLDRTNVIEAILSELLLEDFFEKAGRHRDTFQPFSGGAHPVWTHHRVLWAENGDALSRIYAGTGAINSTYTRTGNAKKTLGSLLSDAAKSAGRMYINNFQDKSKQNVIDALLGNMANQRTVEVYDPLHDSVAAELNARLDEYSTTSEISVFTGTWNLNARSPGESLLPWLVPDGMHDEPDVYALGFQEIVPLSPQQILLTDPAKLKVWEGVIQDTLARRPGKTSEYSILRSEQLVGTALVILVKAHLVNHVRQVEATTRKTGLKGMSGNKGGVAIRLRFHDTTLCFVTAHLAAGHSNWEERNADYWTISRGLSFQRGRGLSGHDHVIWLGDFNYRIELPNERARALANQDDYAGLYAHDQLQRSHQMGNIFVGFEEGPLLFRPTYKYDVGTDLFDSSEKQRVPAWTDRILYSRNEQAEGGHQLHQTSYFRAELKTSDHRPVYATFKAEVRVFDKEKRNAMRREIFSAAKMRQARGLTGSAYVPPRSQPSSRTPSMTISSSSSDRDDLDGDNADLPPPSEDTPTGQGKNWFDVSDDEQDDDDSSSRTSSSSSSDSYFSDGSSSGNHDTPAGRNPFLAKRRSRHIIKLQHGRDSSPASGISFPSDNSDAQAPSSSSSFTASRRPAPPAPPARSAAPAPASPQRPPALPNRPTALSTFGTPPLRSTMRSGSSPSQAQLGLGVGSSSAGLGAPIRPRLGMRSTSYTSFRERQREKNLLDDSD